MSDSKRVLVFLVAPADQSSAIAAARRIWGCTTQAGACVSGVLMHPGEAPSGQASLTRAADAFPDLPAVLLPALKSGNPGGSLDSAAEVLLSDSATNAVLNGKGVPAPRQPVVIDVAMSTVSIFLPGFEKSEVKLQQVRCSVVYLWGQSCPVGTWGQSFLAGKGCCK